MVMALVIQFLPQIMQAPQVLLNLRTRHLMLSRYAQVQPGSVGHAGRAGGRAVSRWLPDSGAFPAGSSMPLFTVLLCTLAMVLVQA